ncbi:IS66 family transposase [Xenorhabdus thailandensis]|uniref:IS66 family transposase n=1 Tax=Xenorhabdus thailandensis TaxID=3136255 RepID=UPI003BF5FFA2
MWCVQLGSKVHVLVALMRAHLRNEHLICADETPVQVLHEVDYRRRVNLYVGLSER